MRGTWLPNATDEEYVKGFVEGCRRREPFVPGGSVEQRT